MEVQTERGSMNEAYPSLWISYDKRPTVCYKSSCYAALLRLSTLQICSHGCHVPLDIYRLLSRYTTSRDPEVKHLIQI